MSEQRTDQTSSQAARPKLEATSAAAALALAVTRAEKSGAKPSASEPSRTRAASLMDHLRVPAEWRNQAPRAAIVGIAVALAWTGVSQALSAGKTAGQAVPGWAEAASASIRQNQEDIARLTGDVRGLKNLLESVNEGFVQLRVEASGQQRVLLERVAGVERKAHEAAAKIGQVADAYERIERASTDATAKLAALSSRIEGMERQSAKGTTAGSDGPAQTGSVPDVKTALRQTPVEGWVLREVYDGIALLEARNGRLHEVVPGQNLPTLGRVEAIERRGRNWVVVTSKGIIGAPERWQ
jgi:hypothetical protein